MPPGPPQGQGRVQAEEQEQLPQAQVGVGPSILDPITEGGAEAVWDAAWPLHQPY